MRLSFSKPLLRSFFLGCFCFFASFAQAMSPFSEGLQQASKPPHEHLAVNTDIREFPGIVFMTIYSSAFADQYNLPADGVVPLSEGLKLIEFVMVKVPEVSPSPFCFFNLLLTDDLGIPLGKDKRRNDEYAQTILRADKLRDALGGWLQIADEIPIEENQAWYMRRGFTAATTDFIYNKSGKMTNHLFSTQVVENIIPGTNYFSSQFSCAWLQSAASYSKAPLSLWAEKSQHYDLLHRSPRPERKDGYSKFHYVFNVPEKMSDFIAEVAPTYRDSNTLEERER